MPRILVRPELLQALSAEFQRAASQLRSVAASAGNAVYGLDWEVREQVGLEGQTTEASRRGQALAEEAEAMARLLWAKAQAFADADRSAAAAIDQVIRPASLAFVQAMLPTPVTTGAEAEAEPALGVVLQ